MLASTLIYCDDPQLAALAEAAWSSERQSAGAAVAAACPERAVNWTALCTCMENEYIPLGRCPACASEIFKEQVRLAEQCSGMGMWVAAGGRLSVMRRPPRTALCCV